MPIAATRRARLLAVVALAAVSAACGHRAPANLPRVIILGIDGMDPKFLEGHWSDLPHLDSLRRAGEFKRLRTVMPPQSPVAWATFLTGTSPVSHGIYDFVHRNPRTLEPFSSLGVAEPSGRVVKLGAFQVPLTAPTIRTFLRGRPFWDGMVRRGIPVTILRMPVNYPPLESEGDELSGMGVPDMQGTFGTFSFYTDDPIETRRDVPGGRIISTRVENGHAVLRILGPPNPYRRDGAFVALDMAVDVDAGNANSPVARFTVAGRTFILRQGEWSDWIEVEFPLIGGLKSAHGMFRVYARRLGGAFQVYVSPVNIDPRRPEAPISAPASYSGQLADRVGLYYTQGMPEETAAIRQQVFNRQEYLEQSRIVAHEQIGLLQAAIREFHGGLLFFHFFAVDQDSHILWGKFDDDLLQTYRLVDDMVGWVRGREPSATLIVMSDHGFSAFNRAVNLNTWLLAEGFLRLARPLTEDQHDLVANVDWAGTQAYSLGLNSLYLNLQGRESQGSVDRRDAAELARRIAARLAAWRDPDTRKPVVNTVWIPHPQFSGDIEYAPDLVAGFAAGYRASWDGALGSIGQFPIEDNQDAWIGDHCMDPNVVPGVLLENRKSMVDDPALQDLSTSIPLLFGLRAPEAQGRNIY